MIHFNYKGDKYTIYFYPCNYCATIQKVGGKIPREIMYDNKLTVKDFLKKLEKINFM